MNRLFSCHDITYLLLPSSYPQRLILSCIALLYLWISSHSVAGNTLCTKRNLYRLFVHNPTLLDTTAVQLTRQHIGHQTHSAEWTNDNHGINPCSCSSNLYLQQLWARKSGQRMETYWSRSALAACSWSKINLRPGINIDVENSRGLSAYDLSRSTDFMSFAAIRNSSAKVTKASSGGKFKET